MSRKSRLKGIFDSAVEELAAANSPDANAREPAGPVRTMALTLEKMETEARILEEAIRTGEHIVNLDPSMIETSFVRDRLDSEEVTEEDDLVRSIRENGQEVPILVREHPERHGRYQVAYGHRRLQALRLLNQPVRAIIRPLSDTEVVVAQGVENSARQNLSYIERALFAFTLENGGFDRATIMQALATDKTELSKLISVARSIPDDIIRGIGSAPSMGRRRWMALAEKVSPKNIDSLRHIIQKTDFRHADSDRRFEMAWDLVENKDTDLPIETWQPEMSGRVSAAWKAGKRSFTLSLKAEDAPDFGAFIGQKLDTLYQEFKQTQAGD